MRYTWGTLILCAAIFLSGGRVYAHHGWSGYDSGKVLELKGTIVESGYEHPHGFVRLKAPDKTWVVVLAEHPYPASELPLLTGENALRCCLAGSRRPEQAEDFAFPDLEANIIDGGLYLPRVGVGQALDRNGRPHVLIEP